MQLEMKLETDDISRYLEASEIIDFHTSAEVAELSRKIFARSADEIIFIKNAYEFVRDMISHSNDIGADAVTCNASEVLRARHGVCYAKSHLLAAILRCGSVPTGLCYQRLILDDELHPYLVLHGLNAVYIRKKWIRLDARGNKPGVDAQFSVEEERLAFPVRAEKGEENIPIIFAVPNNNIIEELTRCKSRNELWQNLPRE
ncbi:MAG: transglutaminase family protein [Clostridiales bacterium]|jgi:transglutaminase-like putative cysteine protease|nr:transglutaminase family protein [Clostridiales bacterium]